jgi:mannosylglycerate hydrolase
VDGLLYILEDSKQYQHFMLDGQTIVLDDYLELRPKNEDRIKQYIRKRRIIIGPWHIFPDGFLVSPEATIRNLLQV